jgi:hypothetical protein
MRLIQTVLNATLMGILPLPRSAVLALFLAATGFASGTETFFVVPGDLTSQEGNSALAYPLNIGLLGLGSQRYQQVYAASQFAGLTSGGGLITKVSFRVNGTLTSFSGTLPDIQLNLSTTSRAVDGLSMTFAENLGSDDTIVFDRGPLTLSGTGGMGPNLFDATITLTTPYFYNPAQGNLLLDVRNYRGGQTSQFDATTPIQGAASRVFTDVSGVNSLLADRFASSFLITQFTFEAPEPSTVVLFPVGGAALLVAMRRAKLRR